ncbi:hypothetical protein CMUS01_12236 [Colletotrichum musicola]|uniref:Uncharacterized protein n=1 Tax=Colletotrichum musicola TaxID=2175873 RepID=A0A8H6JPF5_9PEZI|nr:hypothetical protein CMUS01_12236 [Colletotrichum musicola]
MGLNLDTVKPEPADAAKLDSERPASVEDVHPPVEDVHPPMGYILSISRVLSRENVIIYAGLDNVKFTVPKMLLSRGLVQRLRPSGKPDVSELRLPKEEPDTIGLMVYWCHLHKLPSVTSASLSNRDLAQPAEVEPDEILPGQQLQFQVNEGFKKDKSFEEDRLENYHPNDKHPQLIDSLVDPEILPADTDLRRLQKYLEETEGITTSSQSNNALRAELLQLKLMKLATMASRYQWEALLKGALSAYARGERALKRRIPVLRHVEMA